MIRFVRWLGVSALLAGSLAFSTAQETITIDFYYPTAVDAPINAIIQEYADQFMAQNPGIRINPVYTGTYTQTRDTINTEIAGGGKGPDVAVMLTTDLYSFIEEGVIIPLDDYIATLDNPDAFVADFFPALWLNSLDEDGTIWSIPFQRSTPIMFYNADLFAEKGLEVPTNLDELREVAAALTEPDGSRWGLMIPVQGTFPIWMFQSFAIAHGQNLVSDDPAEVFLNTPEALEAVTALTELGTVDGVMPAGGTAWGDTPSAFVAGQAAMIYHTTGSLTTILNNAPFTVGTAFLPSGPAGADGTGFGAPTGGGNLYIFDTPDNPRSEAQLEAAWKWVQFLASPEVQSDWGTRTGYIAARISAWDIDPLKSRAEEFPQYTVARDQLATAGKEFSSYRAIDIQNIINSTLSQIISGAVPLSEAEAVLANAQAQIDNLLADYR
ncbi:ABC transporter substrate-binding protein [Aggregatilineales bacterium SYSU G02658]